MAFSWGHLAKPWASSSVIKMALGLHHANPSGSSLEDACLLVAHSVNSDSYLEWSLSEA